MPPVIVYCKPGKVGAAVTKERRHVWRIQCRKAKPQANPYKRTDSNGFCLEVKPNGVKARRYRFELSDKESVFAIGDYPAITLVEARKKRDEARELVKQGINLLTNGNWKRPICILVAVSCNRSRKYFCI